MKFKQIGLGYKKPTKKNGKAIQIVLDLKKIRKIAKQDFGRIWMYAITKKLPSDPDYALMCPIAEWDEDKGGEEYEQ